MHDWVNNNYPGTKLAITEYNWGALDDITGAIAHGGMNSAKHGQVIILYGTGEGVTDPPGIAGRLATSELPQPVAASTVAIRGVAAQVQYCGAAPGYTSGLVEINAAVRLMRQAGLQFQSLSPSARKLRRMELRRPFNRASSLPCRKLADRL